MCGKIKFEIEFEIGYIIKIRFIPVGSKMPKPIFNL